MTFDRYYIGYGGKYGVPTVPHKTSFKIDIHFNSKTFDTVGATLKYKDIEECNGFLMLVPEDGDESYKKFDYCFQLKPYSWWLSIKKWSNKIILGLQSLCNFIRIIMSPFI